MREDVGRRTRCRERMPNAHPTTHYTQKSYQRSHSTADVSAHWTNLQHRLARRQQEKAELERHLHAVRAQYWEDIAPLEEEVLCRRMEHLQRLAQRHMQSARHRNAYHDAQRAYESFQEERDSSESPTPDELKRRYRQASKRCHPDAVPDAYRAQAAATFQALESAYTDGHAEAVQAIASALERWGFPKMESEEGQEWRREVDDLQEAVSSLEAAIEALHDTDVYRALQSSDDVDALLQARKRALVRNLHKLKRDGVQAGRVSL